MIITTTPGIEGRSVSEYLGVVAAQGVLGVNVFKDVTAGMRTSSVVARSPMRTSLRQESATPSWSSSSKPTSWAPMR
jgi:uncharacterized protein YbjQ (UPF0145 family)